MTLVYRIHVLVAPSVDGDIVLIVFIDGGITLYLHRIISGFHGAFATDVACHQGTLTLPDTWFRPPF